MLSKGVVGSAREAASNQKSVATLIGMAKTAELGSNNAEALEYYNRALEIDPTIVDAWIGKGRSASWQSTLANFRVSEGLIAFQHAISNAGENRDSVASQSVDEINKIVSALYRMSRSHMEEFASLDRTWSSYLNQIGQMLDALEQARKWAPHNKTVLENIVHLTKDNIEGYKYWDNIHRVTGLHGITPEYEKILRSMMDKAVVALREIDPGYEAPLVEKKQAGACFVVTATMNDAGHPNVVLLRRFRDEWISKKIFGYHFIIAYYYVGPILANLIARSSFCRNIARYCIIAPAVRFAVKRVHRT